MKRYLQLFAILLLVLLVTGGCSKKEEEKKEEGVTKTADQRYADFIDNIKKERVSKGLASSEYISHAVGGLENDFNIILNEDGKLNICVFNSKTNKNCDEKNIAEKVLFYRTVLFGNGGFYSVYYVNEDGNLFKIEVLDFDNLVASKVDNVNNVVNILASKSNEFGSLPTFVDIDGKIITESINVEVKK